MEGEAVSVPRHVKRQRREELRVATRRAVAVLESRGTCWSDWARERGFSLHAVKDVVRDRSPATRGELFEVAARIRVEATAPTFPVPSDPDPLQDLNPPPARLSETLELAIDARARLAALQSGLDRLIADLSEGEAA